MSQPSLSKPSKFLIEHIPGRLGLGRRHVVAQAGAEASAERAAAGHPFAGTFMGQCMAFVAMYGTCGNMYGICGNMCARKTMYNNMYGICGTSAKTPFVLTPSGSQ